MPDEAPNPNRYELTGGKEVELKELDAIELLQATSYAGESPNASVINMTVNICTISRIKRGPSADWQDVYPVRSKAEFAALGKSLKAVDVVVLGALVTARAFNSMSDEQKKALADAQDPRSSELSTTDSESGSAESLPTD